MEVGVGGLLRQGPEGPGDRLIDAPQATALHDLPTGTVTFLFTDIEGSTKLVQRLGAEFRAVVEEHHRILREAIRGAGGIDLRTEGDAFFAVFRTADAAVAAAAGAQRGLAAHEWPAGAAVRVRMGMHTGEGALGGDDYLGLDVHRAARIASAGHGGQVLVSATTAALAGPSLGEGVGLRDLGSHRLKDLPDPEQISQVVLAGLPSEFPPLRSLEVPVSLPAFPTGFVGRHDQLGAVRDALAEARLVTLTGPGGTGKTRLAVEAAGGLGERFTDGITFVDLAPITDASLVPAAIASALRLDTTGRDPVDALAERLRDTAALLLLDNMEQVVACAPEVGRLMEGAPGLAVLATSREPLGLQGEQLFSVPPLGVADGEDGTEPGAGGEAVQLFVERARALDPAFDPADWAETIARICARLDGMPLAIELAAGRIRALDPEEILARLDKRLPLLTGGPRDVPERQQTLRAAIEWSHELLEEPERAMFRRLGVFAGGCTLEAAEAVADPDGEFGDTLDVVASLVQKSLVRRDRGAGGGRFSMYETIREYALERLAEAGEATDIELRHARWVLAFAEEAGPHLIAHDQRRWLDRVEDERDNVRAALGWSQRTGAAEPGLRIVTALWRFWQSRGPLSEGLDWSESLLDAGIDVPPTVRGHALIARAGMVYWRGDYDEMERSCREALELFRGAGDEAGEAEALYNLSFVDQMRMHVDGSVEHLTQALEILERLGDREGVGRVHMAWAFLASTTGDLDRARQFAEAAIDELRGGADRFSYENSLGSLAQILMLQGDLDAARPRMTEVFEMGLNEMNLTQVVIAFHMFALMADRSGQGERAMRLVGAAAGLAERLQIIRPSSMVRAYEVDVPAELSPEAVEALQAEGRAMSLEDAVAYARSED